MWLNSVLTKISIGNIEWPERLYLPSPSIFLFEPRRFQQKDSISVFLRCVVVNSRTIRSISSILLTFWLKKNVFQSRHLQSCEEIYYWSNYFLKLICEVSAREFYQNFSFTPYRSRDISKNWRKNKRKIKYNLGDQRSRYRGVGIFNTYAVPDPLVNIFYQLFFFCPKYIDCCPYCLYKILCKKWLYSFHMN